MAKYTQENDTADEIDQETGDVLDPVTGPTVAGLDLSDFAVDEADLVAANREQMTIPVEKPRKTVFFRTHPNLHAAVWCLKDDDSRLWAIAKHVANIPELAPHVAPYQMTAYVDRSAHCWLWPVRLVRPLKPSNGAWDSARAVAKQAETRWLRMQWSSQLKAYDAYVAPVQPGEPQWPTEPMASLVERAFADRRIASVDHPMVKQLLGME